MNNSKSNVSLALAVLVFVVLAAAPRPRPSITSPIAGDVLQGVVNITGSSSALGFTSYEVQFSYGGDGTGNWFLLHQSRESVNEGLLAVWDTTTIADGTYRLRLLVNLEDGRIEEHIIQDLKVRNYSPLETPIPVLLTAVPQGAAAAASAPAPTRTEQPSPTPLPPNPARVTRADIVTMIARGVGWVAGAFGFIGLYLLSRRAARR